MLLQPYQKGLRHFVGLGLVVQPMVVQDQFFVAKQSNTQSTTFGTLPVIEII
jgi:hypothetical protein